MPECSVDLQVLYSDASSFVQCRERGTNTSGITAAMYDRVWAALVVVLQEAQRWARHLAQAAEGWP